MWTTPAELATYLNTKTVIMSTAKTAIAILGLVKVVVAGGGWRSGEVCYLPAPA